MKNGKPQMLLFDLDGTLVDSVPDIAYSIDRMLEEMGRPPQGEDKVREWVGRGAERLVMCALNGSRDGGEKPVLFAPAFERFSELYLENTSERSRLYPGVRETLDYLAQAAYPLGCITNKRGKFTEKLLASLGIIDDFALVISGDTLAQKKPDPLPLVHAARQFGVASANGLMVGDSVNDVQAARAAGMPVICVTYGYNHGEDIAASNPDLLVDSLLELTRIF